MATTGAAAASAHFAPQEPFNYGHHTHNISHIALAIFSASIYSDSFAVPIVELGAYALLVLSLCVVLLRISLHQRTYKQDVADSWEPLPATDVAVQVFTAVVALSLVAAMLALGLMLLPMQHTGAFVTGLYSCARPGPSAPAPLRTTPRLLHPCPGRPPSFR